MAQATNPHGIPPRRRLSPVVRLQQAFTRRTLRKMLGREVGAPASVPVMSHLPLLAPAYGMLEAALTRSRVDPRLAELARARVATIHGCPW